MNKAYMIVLSDVERRAVLVALDNWDTDEPDTERERAMARVEQKLRKQDEMALPAGMLSEDPADFGALLLSAVNARRASTGESEVDVARLCGASQGNFWRALRNPNARPETVRAVCRALGLRVVLV